MSRSLRQGEVKLTKNKETDKTADQYNIYSDSFALPELKTDDISSVTDASSYSSTKTPYKTTRQQFGLNNAVPENKNATLMKSMPVNEDHFFSFAQKRSHYLNRLENRTDSLPTLSKTLQHNHSGYVKGNVHPFTYKAAVEKKIIELEATEKQSLVPSEESDRKPFQRQNNVFASLTGNPEITSHSLKEHVISTMKSSANEKEFSDAGIGFINKIESINLQQKCQY